MNCPDCPGVVLCFFYFEKNKTKFKWKNRNGKSGSCSLCYLLLQSLPKKTGFHGKLIYKQLMSLKFPFLNDKVFIFPDLFSWHTQTAALHMDLVVGTGKMCLIKWGNYFKFEKGLAIISRIYLLKYWLQSPDPLHSGVAHMHFSSHSQFLYLWRATYHSHPSWGDGLLQLAGTSFSQGVTISSPAPQRNLVSPCFLCSSILVMLWGRLDELSSFGLSP